MISKSLSGGFYIATFDHPKVSGTLPIQHLGPFRHITGLPLRRKWLRPSVLDAAGENIVALGMQIWWLLL